MKVLLFGYGLLCLLITRGEARPQITKLFPVQELVAYHQQVSNEVKPVDKFLGKLRATYNFVFRKPDNTSNVEKILAKDAANPDVETIKQIWSGDKSLTGTNRSYEEPILEVKSLSKDDWPANIQYLAPLAELELQDEWKETGTEMENRSDDEAETVTPSTTLQLPTAIRRHLVEWLGSLLGLTYSIYAKLATAYHSHHPSEPDQ